MGRLAAVKNLVNTLTARMVLGIVLIHALLVPLWFGGLLFIVKSGYEAQFINQVRNESRLFAVLVGHEFTSSELSDHLDDILLDGIVSSAQIIDVNGQVIYDLDRSVKVSEFKEDFFFGQHDDAVYNIATSVYTKDGKLLATLHLGYDETPTNEQIDLAYRRSFYLAIIYMILSLALVTFSGMQLTRSLRWLRDVARNIVSGSGARQFNVPTSISEVTNLGEDLERMRLQLLEQARLLEYQTLHDSLTGLPNRTLLYDRLQQALAVSRRSHKNVALLIIDLDHFKDVNDKLGHHAGDLLLQEVAARLRGVVRESDTVARLSGDEFAVLLTNIEDAGHAVIATEEILKRVYQPTVIDGHTLTVGGSIGIVLSPAHGDDKDTLMRRADLAMYHAKRRKSGYAMYGHHLEE
ncbi:MAG: diguanylate cyclase [Gammaproteobacteria bacterium]